MISQYENILKKLVSRSKAHGFITYDEVNNALPLDKFTIEQLDDLLVTLIESDAIIVEKESNSNVSFTPLSKVLSKAVVHVNKLMGKIIEMERDVHEKLFGISDAVTEGIKILAERQGSSTTADTSFMYSMNAYRETSTDPQNIKSIMSHLRKAGLTRGDTWQIYSEVSASFSTLPEGVQKSLAFIAQQQKEVLKLRDEICKAYAPVMSNIISKKGSDDRRQDGLIALLEAMDSFTYDQTDFAAFATDRINESFAAMYVRETERDEHLIRLSEIDKDIPEEKSLETPRYMPAEEPHIKELIQPLASSTSPSEATDTSSALSGIDKITPKFVDDSNLLVKSKPVYQRTVRELVKTINVKALLTEPGNGLGDIKELQGMTAGGAAQVAAGRRLSAKARLIGIRAEAFVLKHLLSTLSEEESKSLCWVSKEGVTPGWDIEYIDAAGQPIKIEVKGTEGKVFPNIDISGNEWNAAKAQGVNFWLYIVSQCTSDSPKIAKINDPFSMAANGRIRAFPLIWRLEMLPECSKME